MKEYRSNQNSEKLIITIDVSKLPEEEFFAEHFAELIAQQLRQKHRRHTRRGDETFGYTVRVITE